MPTKPSDNEQFSPYINFDRETWATLRNSTPLPLTEQDLANLRSLNDPVSLDEVREIYLPLARLLDLYVTSAQQLYKTTDEFLGHHSAKVPYVIGVAGSVAVGKSTTARLLQTLLQRWPAHPRVDLVTTDGFLFPNKVLKSHGLMQRKGFPESYDRKRLIQFMIDVKSGRSPVAAPRYSHLIYDIIPGKYQIVDTPDIMIIEGLNILQGSENYESASQLFVSDFFDFSIYVDASEENLEQWYIDRFLRLRETAFRNPNSYFRNYADLSIEEAWRTAQDIWQRINAVNLVENIEPTRERAKLILRKEEQHSVECIQLRKL